MDVSTWSTGRRAIRCWTKKAMNEIPARPARTPIIAWTGNGSGVPVGADATETLTRVLVWTIWALIPLGSPEKNTDVYDPEMLSPMTMMASKGVPENSTRSVPLKLTLPRTMTRSPGTVKSAVLAGSCMRLAIESVPVGSNVSLTCTSHPRSPDPYRDAT